MGAGWKVHLGTPEISEEAIREIIRMEMDRQNVRITKIDRRMFEVKGFAWITCTKNHPGKKENGVRHWPSAHAWCKIDLMKQTICYRYFQGCKKHGLKDRPKPEFTKNGIEKMAKYVVTAFQIWKGLIINDKTPLYSTETGETDGGHHDEQLCVKCRKLKRSCWKRISCFTKCSAMS